MKKLVSLIIAAVVVTGASAGATASISTSAPESPPDGSSAGATTSAPESPPEGASLFEATRWINDKQPIDHATWPGFSTFYSFRQEGTLGFMSATPFADSTPLYSCTRTYRWNGMDAIDVFTSPSANCEGAGGGAALIGYVSTIQIPGTIPLYRCLMGKDHFDSILGCEGYFAEGVLGFVFA